MSGKLSSIAKKQQIKDVMTEETYEDFIEEAVIELQCLWVEHHGKELDEDTLKELELKIRQSFSSKR